MRIIRGKYRSRKLKAPPGSTTRPTTDRVRESLFQILETRWLEGGFEGRTVLDLYAGSGSLGIEALSRGARHAIFIESSRSARQCIEENLTNLRVPTSDYTVLQLDLPARLSRISLSGVAAESQVSVVFSDPPYATRDQAELGEALDLLDVLASDAVWVHECESGLQMSCGQWNEEDQRVYGETSLRFMFRG